MAIFVQEARLGSRARGASKVKAVCFNPYVVRFLGICKRVKRLLRPKIAIVYASVTGHVKQYAYRLANLLADAFEVAIMPSDDFKIVPLEQAEAVIQMTSTWGAGAAPPCARPWLAFLNTAEAREVCCSCHVAFVCDAGVTCICQLGTFTTQVNPHTCAQMICHSQI
jgi:hypothetical protein